MDQFIVVNLFIPKYYILDLNIEGMLLSSYLSWN